LLASKNMRFSMQMKVSARPPAICMPQSQLRLVRTETFALFSQALPSQDLGFVDAKTTSLNLSIGGKDITIHQSPSVLSSNRAGGTTGAVVWKVTPLFADWIVSQHNLLWNAGILTSGSCVLELGCGVSALVGLALGPRVGRYVLTDQAYVGKFVLQNLEENGVVLSEQPRNLQKRKSSKARNAANSTLAQPKVSFRALDWELDKIDPSLTGDSTITSFDVVLALDCIYNEALVEPLVQTCSDVCRLRADCAVRPCVCVVGQQMRSPDVFERWLRAMMYHFQIWRVPDLELTEGLRSDKGFVVHLAIFKGSFDDA
jgi:predicted nicotinamide N-methyase